MFRVSGFGFRVSGSGFRGLGFRISGSGLKFHPALAPRGRLDNVHALVEAPLLARVLLRVQDLFRE